MRRIDPGPAAGARGMTDARGAMTTACALALAAALPLAACGSDTAPPLTGNLVDARGAHAGSFRSTDGNDSTAATAANSQDAPR